MRLWSVFCLIHLAVNVILGESPPGLRGFHDGRYKEETFNPQIQGSKYFNSESEDDAENEETSADEETASRRVIDPEVVDQLEGNGWLDVIPGNPGRDYPNYEKIPETSFNCNGKTAGGYYADIEARCQVFHVCNTEGQKISFLCPSGSIFNQKYFVCDWWYDFECDDASDLYSLNDKINRGGTGSGPSGPGNIVEDVDETEYPSNRENFHQTNQDNGNYVSADGFDLSLAGTGEGGPGYARNVNNNNNNKGYQGYEEKDNDRRIPSNADKNESMLKTDQGLINKRREQESRISAVSDTRGNRREHSRKQNTTPATDGNTRVNYQTGYANADSNSNSPIKSDHFLNGRAELQGNEQRADNYNQGSRNKDDNRPQSSDEKTRDMRQERGNDFGQRSSSAFMEEKKNHGNNKNEYQSSSYTANGESAAGRPANTRGRQRTREGSQRGLGNGYPSLVTGDAGESSPGSDDIAVGVIPLTADKVYEAGNQRLVNSQQKTTHRSAPTFTDHGSRSPGQITDLSTENHPQRVGINYQNEQAKRTDFREDNNYFPQDVSVKADNYDYDSTRSKHANNRENNNQNNQSSQNNYGNDYLVGIVPENRDPGNRTSAGSNQARRFLPIL